MDFSGLRVFLDHLTEKKVPGNAIEVYVGGEPVFRYASGYADIEEKRPMTGEEYLNIYSCSKVTTVTAALQLYERGLFLLDDPLYEYMPAFREMYVRGEDGELRPAKNPITLRHLFTMQAGFDYGFPKPLLEKAAALTDGRMDTVTTVNCLAEKPLCFEPGTHWQYSICHDILAAFVEVVSGVRFSEYVRQNIFEPLFMHDTVYHMTKEMESRMASQYRFVEEDGELDPVKLQSRAPGMKKGYFQKVGLGLQMDVAAPGYDSGGAGIVTKVGDYVKLCSALSLGGRAKNGERILTAPTVDLMRRNQLHDINLARDFCWTSMVGYGYGLGVRTLIDLSAGSLGSLGEFGWGGAAGATVLVDPDREFAYFYAHHMLNPQEAYYQPRLRNVAYACLAR